MCAWVGDQTLRYNAFCPRSNRRRWQSNHRRELPCTEEKLLLTECGAVFASAKDDCANMLQMLGKGDVIDEAVIDDLDKIADTEALREMWLEDGQAGRPKFSWKSSLIKKRISKRSASRASTPRLLPARNGPKLEDEARRSDWWWERELKENRSLSLLVKAQTLGTKNTPVVR